MIGGIVIFINTVKYPKVSLLIRPSEHSHEISTDTFSDRENGFFNRASLVTSRFPIRKTSSKVSVHSLSSVVLKLIPRTDADKAELYRCLVFLDENKRNLMSRDIGEQDRFSKVSFE